MVYIKINFSASVYFQVGIHLRMQMNGEYKWMGIQRNGEYKGMANTNEWEYKGIGMQ